MAPEYPQKNELWVYSFVDKSLFSIPSEGLQGKPVFLYDQFSEEKLKDLNQTHTVAAISFWSCEKESFLRSVLDGMLPTYHMVKLYNNWCRCIIVEEGTENIYKDVSKSWRKYEVPGDVMIRISYNGRIVRTQKTKVFPYDPQVCKK